MVAHSFEEAVTIANLPSILMPAEAPELVEQEFPGTLEATLRGYMQPYADHHGKPELIDQLLDAARQDFADGSLQESDAQRWFWNMLKLNDIPFLELAPATKPQLDLRAFLVDAAALAESFGRAFDEASVRRMVLEIYDGFCHHKSPGDAINDAEATALKRLESRWKSSRPTTQVPQAAGRVRDRVQKVLA